MIDSVANQIKPSFLSDQYWLSLKSSDKAHYHRIRPLPAAAYEVDVQLTRLDAYLQEQEENMLAMNGSYDLNPDFQRGHKWKPEQRVRYVESFMRGQAPRKIMFNCPGWSTRQARGDIAPHTFNCIDGLQRLTTLVMFSRGEIAVFDGLRIDDFKGTPFDARRMTVQIAVFEFSMRADLLQFYLDINSAGTPHDETELQRVRDLLASATPIKGETPV